MISPITVFSANLIDSSASLQSADADNLANIYDSDYFSLWQSSSAVHAFSAVFATQISADSLVLYNTNAASVKIEYKQNSSDADFILFSSFENISGPDIFLAFPSVLTAAAVRFTFTCAENVFYIGGLNLCKKVISLDNVLSSLSPSSYFKGGHHYLADGQLLVWQDFSKMSFAVTLNNVPQSVAKNLLKLMRGNAFLTYALYGAFDASFCRQFALSEPPVINAERKSGLYTFEFTLLER